MLSDASKGGKGQKSQTPHHPPSPKREKREAYSMLKSARKQVLTLKIHWASEQKVCKTERQHPTELYMDQSRNDSLVPPVRVQRAESRITGQVLVI